VSLYPQLFVAPLCPVVVIDFVVTACCARVGAVETVEAVWLRAEYPIGPLCVRAGMQRVGQRPQRRHSPYYAARTGIVCPYGKMLILGITLSISCSISPVGANFCSRRAAATPARAHAVYNHNRWLKAVLPSERVMDACTGARQFHVENLPAPAVSRFSRCTLACMLPIARLFHIKPLHMLQGCKVSGAGQSRARTTRATPPSGGMTAIARCT